MKSLLLLTSVFAGASAFAPVAFFSRVAETGSATTSSLSISSETASSWSSTIEKNPYKNIQAYLKKPGPIYVRSNLDGKALVSGLVRTPDRTDQLMFDLLNQEESQFKFEKIIAFVDDAAFAKKRLLSRSARYTGLLDKLDFIQAVSPGALPTTEQLEGVNSWVHYIDSEPNMLDIVKEIGKLAKSAPSMKNVAVVLAGAINLEIDACKSAVESLAENAAYNYTLVAVGKLTDTPEGVHCYEWVDIGSENATLKSVEEFSREESCRLCAELLQLDVGRDRAIMFAELFNETYAETKLVKGLREAGYSRAQEIDHMIREGPQAAAYKAAIEAFEKENPYAGQEYTSDTWWLAPEYQEALEKMAKKDSDKLDKIKDERTKEIEEVAKEWVKREFYRQSMAGSIDAAMTVDKFSETVWERALFEGDLKYRQAKGEVVDEAMELTNFKTKQERKAAVMLNRAKQEMKDILDAEDLGGEDLKDVLSTEDDSKKA